MSFGAQSGVVIDARPLNCTLLQVPGRACYSQSTKDARRQRRSVKTPHHSAEDGISCLYQVSLDPTKKQTPSPSTSSRQRVEESWPIEIAGKRNTLHRGTATCCLDLFPAQHSAQNRQRRLIVRHHRQNQPLPAAFAAEQALSSHGSGRAGLRRLGRRRPTIPQHQRLQQRLDADVHAVLLQWRDVGPGDGGAAGQLPAAGEPAGRTSLALAHCMCVVSRSVHFSGHSTQHPGHETMYSEPVSLRRGLKGAGLVGNSSETR